MRICKDDMDKLKDAKVEGTLHETLLDRRSKMKADRYCKWMCVIGWTITANVNERKIISLVYLDLKRIKSKIVCIFIQKYFAKRLCISVEIGHRKVTWKLWLSIIIIDLIEMGNCNKVENRISLFSNIHILLLED